MHTGTDWCTGSIARVKTSASLAEESETDHGSGLVVAVDGPSGAGKSRASRGAGRALRPPFLAPGSRYWGLTRVAPRARAHHPRPGGGARAGGGACHRGRHRPGRAVDPGRRHRRVRGDQDSRGHRRGQRRGGRTAGPRSPDRDAAGDHRQRRGNCGRGPRHRHRGRARRAGQGVPDRRRRGPGQPPGPPGPLGHPGRSGPARPDGRGAEREGRRRDRGRFHRAGPGRGSRRHRRAGAEVPAEEQMTMANEAVPVVAVVGRPNGGQSTLVNRILRSRQAVVEDKPGVTRDRVAYDALWNGRAFTLVDTGGWEPSVEGSESLAARVAAQARVAVDAADAVLFVVDATGGVTDGDAAVASVLRRSGKPVVVAANKGDDTRAEAEAAALWSLALGEPAPVSALHGRGSGDLHDLILDALPEAPRHTDTEGGA